MQQITPQWLNNKEFFTKVRLPVLFMPVSRLVVVIPEWLMYSVLVIAFGLYSGMSTFSLMVYVLVIFGFVSYGFSVGLLFCAISSRVRDMIHALPLFIQVQLLMIVVYLMQDLELHTSPLFKVFPPFVFIQLIMEQTHEVSELLTALGYTLILPVITMFVYVKMSWNALERI